ncbi:MAG: family 16 glycoside hydrolase, partial [Verrucomicrobiota bacterium]
DWVTVEIEVRGHEVIRHFAVDEMVLEYQKPILDDSHPEAKKMIDKAEGKIELTGGTISLQSESHPVEFRRVEILPLKS